jgi:hypothetical protein
MGVALLNICGGGGGGTVLLVLVVVGVVGGIALAIRIMSSCLNFLDGHGVDDGGVSGTGH